MPLLSRGWRPSRRVRSSFPRLFVGRYFLDQGGFGGRCCGRVSFDVAVRVAAWVPGKVPSTAYQPVGAETESLRESKVAPHAHI